MTPGGAQVKPLVKKSPIVNVVVAVTVIASLKLTVWAVNTYVAVYEGRDAEKSSPPAVAYACFIRKGTRGTVSSAVAPKGTMVVGVDSVKPGNGGQPRANAGHWLRL